MLGNRTANLELYTQQTYLSIMNEKNESRGKKWHKNKIMSKLDIKKEERKVIEKSRQIRNKIQCAKDMNSHFMEEEV